MVVEAKWKRTTVGLGTKHCGAKPGHSVVPEWSHVRSERSPLRRSGVGEP